MCSRVQGGGCPAPIGAPQVGFLLGILFLVGFQLGEGRGKEGEGEREGKGGAAPFLVLFGLKGRGHAACPGRPLSLSTRAHRGPLVPPGVPVTLRHSGFLRNHPEHFRCLNIVVQYINLYVSTISRLLVMSVFTSGTPNKFRYIKTYKLIVKLSS